MHDVAPHSLETERIVLAALLKDPNTLSQIASFISWNSFYIDDHQLIFNAIVKTIEQCGTADLAAVYTELSPRRVLQYEYVAVYLAELTIGVPEPGDIMLHAQILYEYELNRMLLEIFTSNAEQLQHLPTDPFAVFERVRSWLESVGNYPSFRVCRSLREKRDAAIRDLAVKLGGPLPEVTLPI